METGLLQQQLLFNLSEAIPAPVFYKAPDLTYLGCNRAFENYFQKKRDELIGKDIHYLYSRTPERAKEIHEQDLAFINSPDTEYIYESDVPCPDDSVHHFQITKAKFFHPDGTLGGIAAVMFDNTEFEQTKQALEKEKLFLRTLMDAIPEAIVYKSTDLRYIDCNKAFEKFSNQSRDFLIGKNAFDAFPPERAKYIHWRDENFLKSTKERETFEFKHMIPPVNGEIRHFVVSRAKFRLADGVLGGFVTTVFDIHERKVLESDLKETHQKVLAGIDYAARVQKGILLEPSALFDHFPESFIFFQPKDAVSGDFYWCARRDDIVLIAAVDCTGHGVPGALMTVLGHAFLNQIIYEQNVLRPDLILSMLDIKLKDVLQKRDPSQEINDGMDISICAIDLKNNSFQFSGAKCAIWHAQNGEIERIAGSRFTIGGKPPKKEKIFELNEKKINQGDHIYFSTDGYYDQLAKETKQRFMKKNFESLLQEIHTLPMEQQRKRIEKAWMDWKGDFIQTDDILVMGIRVT